LLSDALYSCVISYVLPLLTYEIPTHSQVDPVAELGKSPFSGALTILPTFERSVARASSEVVNDLLYERFGLK
jgi:hypothetical protein